MFEKKHIVYFQKPRVEFETEKVNDLLTIIPTKDITELNDWISGGAKLVGEKSRVFLKTIDRKSKPE